jgi:hypothetical protein
VTKIGALGTTQAATSNRRTLRRNTNWYFFAEDTILHSHRRENLKSYSLQQIMDYTKFISISKILIKHLSAI